MDWIRTCGRRFLALQNEFEGDSKSKNLPFFAEKKMRGEMREPHSPESIENIWSEISKSKRSVYSASKSGLIGATRGIAIDLAKNNILVNSISPGFVNTNAVKINDFKMPGLIEPNVAAKLILKNISNKKFEITFP